MLRDLGVPLQQTPYVHSKIVLGPSSLKSKENEAETDERSWGKLMFMDNRTNSPCPTIDFKLQLDGMLGHFVHTMVLPRKVELGDP